MKRNCVTLSSAALGCVLSFHGRRIVEALQERERKKFITCCIKKQNLLLYASYNAVSM